MRMEMSQFSGLRGHDGTVLMEFLLVFPIYLILFAGLFMLGDMLLRPIWLSSMERVSAHDLGELNNDDGSSGDYGEGNQSHRGWLGALASTMDVGGMVNSGQDNPKHADRLHFTEPDFKGPWAFCAASGATDDYSLFELTRGQLASVPVILPDVPEAPRVSDPEFDAWVRQPGNTRVIYSNNSTRRYNYYTYKRAHYAQADLSKTYRARLDSNKDDPDPVGMAGRLVDDVAEPNDLDNTKASWYRYVACEPYPSVASEVAESETRNGELPELMGRDAYRRYEQFETWSE